MNDKVEYWLEIADYDFETAQAMLNTGRYLYVGFMCHQVIEKALKAAIAKSGVIPPRIHNLSKLATLAHLYDSFDVEQKDFIDALDPLNLETRYPEEMSRLAEEFDAATSRKLYEKTTGLFQWIKRTLSSV